MKVTFPKKKKGFGLEWYMVSVSEYVKKCNRKKQRTERTREKSIVCVSGDIYCIK